MGELKYYTSEVPAIRSINRIEEALVNAGAHDINKKYEEGKLIAISFLMTIQGQTIPFRLPARVKFVEKILKGKVKKPTDSTYERIKKQSERTAWRIVHEWVEIQMTMIKLEQAEFLELFLPHVYNYNKDESFYTTLKSGEFKALPIHNESNR